jgi:hypothetical protein
LVRADRIHERRRQRTLLKVCELVVEGVEDVPRDDPAGLPTSTSVVSEPTATERREVSERDLRHADSESLGDRTQRQNCEVHIGATQFVVAAGSIPLQVLVDQDGQGNGNLDVVTTIDWSTPNGLKEIGVDPASDAPERIRDLVIDGELIWSHLRDSLVIALRFGRGG